MELPVGMLVFWAHRYSDELSSMSGLWYYKELYVPVSVEEKIQSISDLKSKRCLGITISGTFGQILDLLLQCDKFQNTSPVEISEFHKLREELEKSKDKHIFFDDSYKMKGTALTLDTIFEVDETMEEIQKEIRKNTRHIKVTISKNWSFANDVLRELEK